MSISTVILSAFQPENFQTTICYSEALNQYSVLKDKATVPSGFKKMSFISILNALSQVDLTVLAKKDKSDLSSKMSYLNHKNRPYQGSSTLKKVIYAVCRFILRVFHFIQGNGFQTPFERGCAFVEKLITPLKISEEKLLARPGETPHQFRTRIFQGTYEVCESQSYEKGGKIHLLNPSKMLENTYSFDHPVSLDPLPEAQRFKTQFKVFTKDTINCMHDHVKQGHRVVGINMANRYKFGGGVESGCPAQEEEICRRSNHLVGLKKNADKYPLSEFGGIYCPDVTFFREDASKHFAFMDEPFQAALIATAAYDLRKGSSELAKLKVAYKTLEDGTATPVIDEAALLANKPYADGTKAKIRHMLRVLAKEGHEYLVLGALGCGAFLNPPKVIAHFFYEVFKEEEFVGRFREVDFAVLVQYDKDKDNVVAFEALCENLKHL